MNRNDLVDADIPSEANNTSACSSDLAFALNHSVSPTTHMRVLHLPFQKLPDVARGRKKTDERQQLLRQPRNRRTKTWKGREGATRQLEGGKLGTGSRGRRRGKVSAAGPPSPPLISSISSNHCDRRRAEREKVSREERGGPMEGAGRGGERRRRGATVKMSKRKGGWSTRERESASD